MQPRINVITLGVKDIARSRKFYEKLGWKASSISTEGFAVFQLGGVILFLYPEKSLAEDANLSGTAVPGFRGISLSYNTSSKEDVDQVIMHAVEAGGKLQKRAQDVFWGGYSGYFADPDGHLWEVAWNPHWKIKSDGTVQLPA